MNMYILCISGAAGCVATVLHDLFMNPADGEYCLICLKSHNVKPE